MTEEFRGQMGMANLWRVNWMVVSSNLDLDLKFFLLMMFVTTIVAAETVQKMKEFKGPNYLQRYGVSKHTNSVCIQNFALCKST